jgi:hypothetical protein
MAEQVMEEAINHSEIERLTARRQRIFTRLADTDLSSRDREDLSYELERLSEPLHGQNASQGGLLALAFAVRRRLAVSRSLMRAGGARHVKHRRPRFRRYRVTDEWETCPDCSARDAVSFTFGRISSKAVDDPVVVGGARPVLSFARSERGVSLVRGCETCAPWGNPGMIPVLRNTAIPAAI